MARTQMRMHWSLSNTRRDASRSTEENFTRKKPSRSLRLPCHLLPCSTSNISKTTLNFPFQREDPHTITAIREWNISLLVSDFVSMRALRLFVCFFQILKLYNCDSSLDFYSSIISRNFAFSSKLHCGKCNPPLLLQHLCV